MSKYSLKRLMEAEMDDDATFSVGKASYDLTVTPEAATAEKTALAFDNIDN